MLLPGTAFALGLVLGLTMSLTLSPARADHGPRPSRLGGSVLCLDDTSAQAAIYREQTRDEAMEAALQARANAQMRAVFERLEVGAEIRPSCQDAPAYTQLRLLAQALDPEVYVNFPDESYSTTVLLQVGAYHEVVSSDPEDIAQDALHVLFSNDLHSEAESGLSVSEHLNAIGDAQIRALARAWWDDNAESYAPARPLAPLVGSGLAVLTLLLGWRLLRRR